MSNLGLERYVGGPGLTLARTKVGDRYVVEEMRRAGDNVGGEQSGHVVLSDYATTGDGLLTALQVLSVVVQSGKPVSEVCRRFEPVPQLLKSVRYSNGNPLESDSVKGTVEAGAGCGSVFWLGVAPPAPELVIRVMAEGDDLSLVTEVVDEIAASIERCVSLAA